MRDDDKSDWSKLMSVTHIDMATRYVKRLALSFQQAFVIVFSQTLDQEELESFLSHMETLSPVQIADNWNTKFEKFTFALHYDMLNHCIQVVCCFFNS